MRIRLRAGRLRLGLWSYLPLSLFSIYSEDLKPQLTNKDLDRNYTINGNNPTPLLGQHPGSKRGATKSWVRSCAKTLSLEH